MGVKKATEAQAKSIREKLFRLVDNRLITKDCESLFDYQRKYPGQPLFPGPLCPFVNRLCPDDLCYLPAAHPGTPQGFHITGTVAYDYAVQWSYGDDMMPIGTSRQKLMERGARLQAQTDFDQE